MTGEGEVEVEVVVGVVVEVLPWGEEVGEHLNLSFLHLGFLLCLSVEPLQLLLTHSLAGYDLMLPDA